MRPMESDMTSFEYMLTGGAALMAFMGIMMLLRRVLVSSMTIKTLLYSLPVG